MDNTILDSTINILKRVDWALGDGGGDYDLLLTNPEAKSVSEFWGINTSKLEKEIRSNFIELAETKVQDRYANYLIDHLNNNIIPIYSLAEIESKNCKSDFYRHFSHLPSNESDNTEREVKITSLDFFTDEAISRFHELMDNAGPEASEDLTWCGRFSNLAGDVENIIYDTARLLNTFALKAT